ncbi:MAG: glutamine--fructose-6-phosphate transaminase (isomerizing) [Spirochaeta sp. LUC14_002_19_P3]|nr:MAG: glutamine--fructose-6-phosphate transaminase (isomerizing) [Spirochaeta sp. LUC14_002_19_P3]
MCGIIGYCGKKHLTDVLLTGLKRLEYRGYDSAGICLGNSNSLTIYKKEGKIRDLTAIVPREATGSWGMGHTRWATHGGVTDVNAHPHTDCSGKIAICHNGIIENYSRLKEKLGSEGHSFHTETDSEVIAHLIESMYSGDLEKAVKDSVPLLQGTFGLLVMHADHPCEIIGARNGSPLVLGIGENEMFLASDVSAMMSHTKQVVYCEDGEVVKLSALDYQVSDLRNRPIDKEVSRISWELEELEKGKFSHFMIKEIFEQVQSIPRAMNGRVDENQATARLGGLNMTERELLGIKRVVIIAAGTSFYAGQTAAWLLESLARIPAVTELASELRYRNPLVEEGTLYFAVSQSGETLDTLMAVRELQSKGARVLGICNVVGSTIARESDGGVYIHSGPEIAVASTKAFTSQLTALYLFILKMARMRHMAWLQGQTFIEGLLSVPRCLESILARAGELQALAKKYHQAESFLFLGRGINYPVALEGALKLKEIAYIHAEGCSAAEIKHGPIALINQNTPSMFLVPEDHLRSKLISNMKEIKARGGPVIALCMEGDRETAEIADDVFYVPKISEEFSPFVMVVPLQLFAYYCALELERNVDQPRNLAKSVTVE